MRKKLLAPLVYLVVSAALTWPALIQLGSHVPGSDRTDLWNSLWSIWFVEEALRSGHFPLDASMLNYPFGGELWVADPLGDFLAAPLSMIVGLPVAYTLLVVGNLVFSGLVAHGFARELGAGRGAWVAGVGYASAPVLLSGIHNGTSEALAGGWAALAAWMCWRAARHGGWKRVVAAGGSLALAALGSWYGAVVAFLFAGALVVLGTGDGLLSRWKTRLLTLAVGLALTAPIAAGVHSMATSEHNLVGIKHAKETASVRRTTGPADPVGWFHPGDYRSPDFRKLSRYGELFFHCHYLGYALMLCAGAGALKRDHRKGTAFLWVAGLAGMVLAMGPVVARFGMPVFVMRNRVIPLPYFLLEGAPGFSSLSLLYRLGQAPALALALLAGIGIGRYPRMVPVAVAAILLEGRFLSPLGSFPDTTSAELSPAIDVLAHAPDGAVMNFPVVGGRDYLYEQTRHHKPLAGSLNFPNNISSRTLWSLMLEKVNEPPEKFHEVVSAKAKAIGVRYLVVHIDPNARPDMHDQAIVAVKAAFSSLPAADGSDTSRAAVRVYDLW